MCQSQCLDPKGETLNTYASARRRLRVSHSELVELLKQDLLRKYHVYAERSQLLKSVESRYSSFELEMLLTREIQHAMIIARQIDKLCSIRLLRPHTSYRSTQRSKALPTHLDCEPESIQNYRDRIRQCEMLGEYEVAEQIHCVLIDERKHFATQAACREQLVPTQCTSS